MKKKIIFSLASGALLLSLASCNKKAEVKNYNVEIIDIDGEVLFKENIKNEGKTLLEDLKEKTTVTGYDSQYGYTLTSLAGSVIDNNYYVAIYENGEYASTGIDGLVIDENDSFKFQVECWNTKAFKGTLDDTDVLVDKIIYSYAKNQMKEYLKNEANYTALGGYYNVAFGEADYWSFLINNLMVNNNYDTNIFNTKSVPASLKTDLESYDLSTLSGTQFGKYYFAAKALGVDLTNYKTVYQAYLNNLPETYDVYMEYDYPFTFGASKALNLTSENLSKLVNTTYRADTSWGIDGLAWEIASLAQFVDLSEDELSAFEAKDYGNAISTSIALASFAALGVNPRADKYKKDGKDLVEILIENYYDSTNKIIKYSSTESTNSNTPQIYLYLMAYKVARDSGKKTFVFA